MMMMWLSECDYLPETQFDYFCGTADVQFLFKASMTEEQT